jgi:Zn-dependent protease
VGELVETRASTNDYPMNKQALSDFVRSPDGTTTIGHVFGTPVVIKGKTWFPVAELIVWGIMTLVAGRERPNRPWRERLGVGALTSLIILGSEWCHNLAHAAAAQRVGKPADGIRISLGMPVLLYPTAEDPTVTPRQHIARSLAGPAFNGLLLLVSSILRRFTRPNTLAREAADAAVGMNLFISTAALVPNPEIDGGPTFKWALVSRGYTPERADRIVKESNKFVGPLLAGAAGLAAARKRYFVAFVISLFSLISLDYGFRQHE